MISATAPALTLVLSSLDHPDARTLADQLDGELASIYGGPTTGRDTALPVDFAPPHGLFFIGYLVELTFVAKDPSSEPSGSPTLYRTDRRSWVVQGLVVTDPDALAVMDIP
ncbi:MAG TPA: hypothetical protein VN327_03035, partial [Pseudonocardiaceae bacterium]|nr:hypothetical protein [Pseudonocardiaceae bacterium]